MAELNENIEQRSGLYLANLGTRFFTDIGGFRPGEMVQFGCLGFCFLISFRAFSMPLSINDDSSHNRYRQRCLLNGPWQELRVCNLQLQKGH